MWARNDTNIKLVRKRGQGVYVLYYGSMPVYIGKGNIYARIVQASRSRRRGQFWDYFSWYVIPDTGLRHDVEAFLLRTQPWYLRGLNRGAKFADAKKVEQQDEKADAIRRKAISRRK